MWRAEEPSRRAKSVELLMLFLKALDACSSSSLEEELLLFAFTIGLDTGLAFFDVFFLLRSILSLVFYR